MSIFKNLFKKKKNYNGNCEFKLLIIKDDTDSFSEALGISDQRIHELGDMTKNAHENYDSLTDAYSEIVSKCKHVNELAFCFTVFARISEMKKERKQMLGLFSKMFDND